MKAFVALVLLSLFSLFITACSKQPSPQAEAVPQHGGVLIPLADKKFHLEVVLDRTEGSIILYVLDSQAKNRVTTSNEGLELHVSIGSGEPRFLILDPGSDIKTGEIAGNTAFFRRTETDWLKTKEPVKVVVDQILVRGRKFEKVETLIPASN